MSPREIAEACLLTPENGHLLWEWAASKPWYGADGQVDGLSIYTPGGRVKADFGDWIVKDGHGAFWPVKPEAFVALAAAGSAGGETWRDPLAETIKLKFSATDKDRSTVLGTIDTGLKPAEWEAKSDTWRKTYADLEYHQWLKQLDGGWEIA
ncbi:hypothetical protein GCM10010404_81200 [Nonomuraea africana]|uniref:Uncharacterized protein n=1 Tax=Nonomuraea africana TaxID=46171 RepID=A0ABR9KY70_9ACTN|nr:hypothetical protein [Nonomuraea africana]MBE1566502.1 hypothetical protein [Nonomuraea africana]